MVGETSRSAFLFCNLWISASSLASSSVVYFCVRTAARAMIWRGISDSAEQPWPWAQHLGVGLDIWGLRVNTAQAQHLPGQQSYRRLPLLEARSRLDFPMTEAVAVWRISRASVDIASQFPDDQKTEAVAVWQISRASARGRIPRGPCQAESHGAVCE